VLVAPPLVAGFAMHPAPALQRLDQLVDRLLLPVPPQDQVVEAALPVASDQVDGRIIGAFPHHHQPGAAVDRAGLPPLGHVPPPPPPPPPAGRGGGEVGAAAPGRDRDRGGGGGGLGPALPGGGGGLG
ncbi:hypothetical protein QU38_00070, partial [Staphylococcus aureus]